MILAFHVTTSRNSASILFRAAPCVIFTLLDIHMGDDLHLISVEGDAWVARVVEVDDYVKISGFDPRISYIRLTYSLKTVNKSKSKSGRKRN